MRRPEGCADPDSRIDETFLTGFMCDRELGAVRAPLILKDFNDEGPRPG